MAPYIPVPSPYVLSPVALINYDFFDFASGTGYKTFYGGSSKDSSTYFLTNLQISSQRTFTRTQSGATSDTIQNDIDFDVKFNLARDVLGDVIISVPTVVRNRRNTNHNYSTFVKVYVRHVTSGGAETDLGSQTGETYNEDISAETRRFLNYSFKINIAAVKHFKIGESFRITVEQHGWGASQADADFCVGHDPNGDTGANNFDLAILGVVPFSFEDTSTDVTSETTTMQVQIPFEINI